MSVASHTRTIDELTGKAARSLEQDRLFDAERYGVRALDLARREGDYVRMLAVLPTVEQSRLRRRQRALNAGVVSIVDSQFTDDSPFAGGCYLVQPPLVGADARRLRALILRREIDACVLCREPVTRLGLMPLVALGSAATVRVQVRPPTDLGQPDVEWFADAREAIGEAATEVDPEMDVGKRIDHMLGRLDAIPEHEGLHRCLELACQEALDNGS